MASAFTAIKIATLHKTKLAELVRSLNGEDRHGETVLEKAITDFAERRPDQAVRDLSKLWTMRGSKGKIDPNVEERGMYLLIDMCLTTDRVSSLKDPMRQYQIRCSRNKIGFGPIERAVKYVLSRAQEMVLAIRGDSTGESTRMSAEATLMEALGINEEAASSPFLKLPNAVCFLLCDRRLFYTTQQRMFLFCVNSLLDMCVALKCSREVFTISRSVNSFCDTLFRTRDRVDNSIDALKNNTPQIAETRFKLLATALTLGNWGVVRDALRTLSSLWTDVESAVKEHNKVEAEKVEFPLGKIDIAEQRFRVVSEVFLENRNWLYHAYASIQQSRFTACPIVLTRAILATVCVSLCQNELAVNEASEDFERVSLIQIADILNVANIPSQQSLRAELLRKADLQKANPSALALLSAVADGNVSDLDTLYTHLRELQSLEWAAPYLPALERTVLEEYMTNYFATKPTLQMSALTTKVLYPDVNDIHLIAISRGATVDVVNHVACYNTAENTVRNSLESLNTAVAAALAVPVAKRRRELPGATSLALQLEREMKQIESINTEQSQCLDNADSRRKDRERKQQDEVKDKLSEAKKAESEQHIKQLVRGLGETKKLLAKTEGRCRRKQCITTITTRYPGVSIPANFSNYDQTQFIESCVRILAPHTIKMEEAKSSAVRDANYFERNIREVEVPVRHRKENDEEAKAKQREEQERRIQNFKDQHRAKYDQAKGLKDIMDTFRAEADRYMSDKVELIMSTQKVSKRDAQEEDLEAEKRRLAELAGETVVAPAARAAAAAAAKVEAKPAAAAAQAEPAAEAPAAARWVPRSKRA